MGEGTYRHMSILPQQVEWCMLTPSTASAVARAQNGRLLLTELDRLNGCSDHLQSASVADHEGAQTFDDLHQTGSVILSCVLPPSAYLTVAVRELTRTS